MDLKTLHFLHILILLSQFPWTSPWHKVPLINQQRCPLWYSQAGHLSLVSEGHPWRSQQGFLPYFDSFIARRNNDCLWAWVGIFRQPCSKLWMALRETAKSWAISLWDFPSRWRISENSLLSITPPANDKQKFAALEAPSPSNKSLANPPVWDELYAT